MPEVFAKYTAYDNKLRSYANENFTLHVVFIYFIHEKLTFTSFKNVTKINKSIQTILIKKI